MASSPFHGIRDALTQSADGIRGSAGRLPSGTSGEGAAAEAIAQRLQRIKHNLTHAADHMDSNASRADTVAHADDELQRHPSPAEVTEATAKAKTVRIMLKAGEVTPAQAAPIINNAEAMRQDRDTAFNIHANSLVSMEPYNPPANSGGGWSSNHEGYNSGGGGQSGTEDTPATLGDLGGSSAGSDGAGGGTGGSSVGDSAVGTTTSGDSDGAGGSALGGQSQGAPSMQPMQGQGQQQGAPAPSTGGGPTAGTGAPFTDLKAMPPKKNKKDGDNGLPTALSGGGAVVPVAGGDQLGPKNGSSVHDVNTKSSTTGQNAPAVSATGAKPGGGAGGGAGGMGRGGMMGGGMGSGAGMGGSAKAKKPDDTISAFQDRNLTGQVNVDHAVEGGSIGRNTSNPPEFEDGNVLNRDDIPKDMRERSERKDI